MMTVAGKDIDPDSVHLRHAAIFRRSGRTVVELISAPREDFLMTAALGVVVLQQPPDLSEKEFRAAVMYEAKEVQADVVMFNRISRKAAERNAARDDA